LPFEKGMMRENAGYNPTRFQIGAIQVLGFVVYPESVLGLAGHPVARVHAQMSREKTPAINFFCHRYLVSQ